MDYTAPGQLPAYQGQKVGTTVAQAPGPVALASQPYAIGTTGIPFGGGAFKWTQHPDGTYGWSAPDGRTWDATGNLRPAAPPQPSQALQQQQAAANPILDFWSKNSGINVNAYNFNKLKRSTQDLVLAGAEAAGHDKADVYEDIQRTLPKAVGPRTGYVAPMGRR